MEEVEEEKEEVVEEVKAREERVKWKPQEQE